MTMPNERTRAVIQTGEFLHELSQDSSLPERIRCHVKFLMRHYQNLFQILLAGRIEEASDSEVSPWVRFSALPPKAAITPRSFTLQTRKSPDERLG